jgi:hypothetical protein
MPSLPVENAIDSSAKLEKRHRLLAIAPAQLTVKDIEKVRWGDLIKETVIPTA